MPRKGGSLINDGLWGVAYANSDGSVVNTVQNRFTYSGYILLGILIVGCLGAILWALFGKVTPKKEAFKNKKVAKRPMFQV